MTDTFFGHIIDNEEVPSADGTTFDVWNPWTQGVFAQAPRAAPRTPTGRLRAHGGPSTKDRGRGWDEPSAPRPSTAWPT
jgi:hypothetical protein